LLVAGLIAGIFAVFAFHIHSDPFHARQDDLLGLGIVLAIVFVILFVALAIVVLRPLQSIAQYVEDLGDTSGRTAARVTGRVLQVAEVELVRDLLDDYRKNLLSMHQDLDRTGRELRALVNHDALTGARNRRAFDEYLKDMPAVLQERRISVSFALFDVCRFRAINDTYGHQTGDEVLKEVAGRIGAVLRRGEDLFRVGGDEFAVIMPGTGEEGAQRLAERCLQAIAEEDFTLLGVREPVRVCVGIASAGLDEPESLASLQWRADIAMYHAKRPGNANMAVFREEMGKSHEGIFSSRVNNAVYEAVTLGNGLAMFYQPIIDLDSGRVLYYEALVRINYQDEWISPSVVFPLVEARRLEVDLDLAVFKKVMEDLRGGKVQRGSGVSINLSGPTVINRNLSEWLAPFRPLMTDYRVVLEVTETALITQVAVASENLSRLRAQGFEIALDDFGSGYSSFHYLASMPVDTVKFDISLIRGLGDDNQRRIVEHLVAMIGEIGHRLVAEGIEDEDTLESVRQAGFTLGQGYFFGKPSASAWRSDFDIDSLQFQSGTVHVQAEAGMSSGARAGC
jgi:diguanylate cyclase (GGDEF)-like protein